MTKAAIEKLKNKVDELEMENRTWERGEDARLRAVEDAAQTKSQALKDIAGVDHLKAEVDFQRQLIRELTLPNKIKVQYGNMYDPATLRLTEEQTQKLEELLK